MMDADSANYPAFSESAFLNQALVRPEHPGEKELHRRPEPVLPHVAPSVHEEIAVGPQLREFDVVM